MSEASSFKLRGPYNQDSCSGRRTFRLNSRGHGASWMGVSDAQVAPRIHSCSPDMESILIRQVAPSLDDGKFPGWLVSLHSSCKMDDRLRAELK